MYLHLPPFHSLFLHKIIFLYRLNNYSATHKIVVADAVAAAFAIECDALEADQLT